MRNEKNNSKSYDLKIEKTIAKPVAEVFRAISQGRLFQNCSADTGSMRVDFRVGGHYELQFKHVGMKNRGEFLEIVLNRIIAFTWCQDYESNPNPDTVVRIELTDLGSRTQLLLTHTGFRDQENCDQHRGGWNGGLSDLSEEMVRGRIRFMRRMEMPADRLFDACKNPALYVGNAAKSSSVEGEFKVGNSFVVPTVHGEFRGEFIEIAPGEKIVVACRAAPFGEVLPPNSSATLTIEKDDDDSQVSWLGIVHDGLTSELHQKAHRAAWDQMFSRLIS